MSTGKYKLLNGVVIEMTQAEIDEQTKPESEIFNEHMENLRDKRKVKLAPKGTFPKKKEPKLDADTVKSYKKRIKYMEGRKAKGKNYSKANLSRLKAELAAN